MPNRNVEGNYRYAFQGQEKDPETGMEAFELRLWDSRIGRWMSPDPYGYGFSPYVGMSNNPISNIDVDGGCSCEECPDTCAGQAHALPAVVIGGGEDIPSGSWGADAASTLGGFDYTFAGSTALYQQTYPEFEGMNYDQMVAQFNQNHGDRFEQEYNFLEAERIKAEKAALAAHLMGVGNTIINTSIVIGVGSFRPTVRPSPRPRLQPPTAASLKPSSLRFDSKQLGRKWGKHKTDYPHLKTHSQYQAKIREVFSNSATKWFKSGDEIHGVLGKDLLRLKPNGDFISFYPGG